MAKVLGLKQLLAKKYDFLESLDERVVYSFGRLVKNFVMIIWGDSGNGKSSFLMQFVKALMPYGKVLYVSMEEGFEATTQINVLRSLTEEEHSGKIEFADSEMKYDELMKKLSKKKSPQFIIIDSIQYWDVNYEKYKTLKEKFKRKTFIFISHAEGKLPSGKTAKDVRYDAGIKAFVQGFIVFVTSRYGGNKPYVINEELALQYWGSREYKKILAGVQLKAQKEEKKKKEKKESLTPTLSIEKGIVQDNVQEPQLIVV